MGHEETKQRLGEAVAALATDEGFQRWLRLRTCTTIGRYSLYNQLLIAHQDEDATRVAGYRSWQKEGRQVTKGEKAIWILAPLKRTWSEADTDTGELRSFTRLLGFTAVPVFDIHQTTGPDLPEYRISPNGTSAAHWEERLVGLAATQGICVEWKDTGSADGYYSPSDNLIVLSDRLEVNGRVHCLVHELVHASGIGYKEFGRETAELIAETATAIVCAELGLDAIEESSFYLVSWAAGDTEKALKHLQVADQIARKLERQLGLRN